MKEMVDPHESLLSFQNALDGDEIDCEPGRIHPELLLHADEPAGERRLSYALVENGVVVALVVFVQAPFIEQTPCFAVGYAVNEQFRNRGIATETLKKSLEELQNGIGRYVPRFYVEAVVGQSNIASQKVAERILSQDPKAGTDQVSGQAIFAYVRLFDIGVEHE